MTGPDRIETDRHPTSASRAADKHRKAVAAEPPIRISRQASILDRYSQDFGPVSVLGRVEDRRGRQVGRPEVDRTSFRRRLNCGYRGQAGSRLVLIFTLCSSRSMNDEQHGPADMSLPEGRDRLGRAHQVRVDISIAIAMAPAWLRRALGDRDIAKARGARIDFVERIAAAIERRFQLTWRGSDDAHPDARPLDETAPLFGGPDVGRALAEGRIDDGEAWEHKGNDSPGGVV
jgi:hypothetical protein